MRPKLSPKVFYLTHEWKRLFSSDPLILSIWLINILYIVGLWTADPFNHIVALLLGIGIYLVYLLVSYFFLYLLTKPLQHIVTSEGITFCSVMYRIYTPWDNIRGIGTSRIGIYRPPALLLEQPAVKRHVREKSHLERAIIVRRWLLTTKKDAPDDAIPLLFTVPANWQESELGLSIKQYVPQIFEETTI